MARAPRKTPAEPSLGPARRGGQGKVFTSPPINIEFAGPEHRVNQIDLELDGVYHGEASFEGRVFFDNPAASLDTPRTAEAGYAGSFHVFGHGGCLGDPGHCELNGHREAYDFRPGHPLTLGARRVEVTETLRALAQTKQEVTVTIVPVIRAANEQCDKVNVPRFEGMRLVGYNP